MKKRRIITVVCIIFAVAVAVWVLISQVPNAFVSCRRSPETVKTTAYFKASLSTVYGEKRTVCTSAEKDAPELKVGVKFKLEIDSGPGTLQVLNEAIRLDYDEDVLQIILFDERHNAYTLCGLKACSDTVIEVHHVSGDEVVTPCSMKLSFI